MTREEAIKVLNMVEAYGLADEAKQMAIKALSQEPCTDAQERYEDLCEYFGDAKDILKSRKDFKAWLERIKWHIRKAEELYEKYEYRQEPCDDAISRQYLLDNCVVDKVTMPYVPINKIENAPSVNPQPCDDAISQKENSL